MARRGSHLVSRFSSWVPYVRSQLSTPVSNLNSGLEGLSSDSSSDSDSDSDPVPVDPVPVDLTPKPRKRIQKKYGSTGMPLTASHLPHSDNTIDSDKAVPVSPQPAASTSKKQQAIQMVPPPAQEIDVYEWEHSIRDLIKKCEFHVRVDPTHPLYSHSKIGQCLCGLRLLTATIHMRNLQKC